MRDAITAANNPGVTVNGCAVGTGTDTINFSTGTGTITLGDTLEIANPTNLTIDGSGQNITISGNKMVRVMFVDPGAHAQPQEPDHR